MWLLVFNGLLYLLLNIASGRWLRKFFPVSVQGVRQDLVAALKGRLSHADPARYNHVQKLAYLFVVLDLVVIDQQQTLGQTHRQGGEAGAGALFRM